jgi:hypothetical protein
MLWPKWVVLIAGSTGSALRAVRPFQPSHHVGCPTRSRLRRERDGFPPAWFVNHPTMVKADLPFGGIRHSGYGRELLGLGIKEFVNHKLIDVVDIDAAF